MIKAGDDDVHKAIMTTDIKEKLIFGELELSGKIVSICGVGKGSGMIHPNMATMLTYVITDAAISKEMLTKIHNESIPDTFNMVTVDGDTSTNDTATIVANGAAGNKSIDTENEDYERLKAAVNEVNVFLARAIAADGEGATRLIEVDLKGAPNKEIAKLCAKSIVSSSLVKAAIHGADANWGRIVCAMGYSGANFDPLKVDVTFKSASGYIDVFKRGTPIIFDEDKALKVLTQNEIIIAIDMNDGNHNAKAWGCDLSAEYVRINGSYRS